MSLFDDLMKQAGGGTPKPKAAAPQSLAKKPEPAPTEPTEPTAPTEPAKETPKAGGLQAPVVAGRVVRRTVKAAPKAPVEAEVPAPADVTLADIPEDKEEVDHAANVAYLMNLAKGGGAAVAEGGLAAAKAIPEGFTAYSLRDLQDEWHEVTDETPPEQRAELIKLGTKSIYDMFTDEMGKLRTDHTERETVSISALIKFTFDRLQRNPDVMTILTDEDLSPIITALRAVANMRQAKTKGMTKTAAKDTSAMLESMMADDAMSAALGDFDLDLEF